MKTLSISELRESDKSTIWNIAQSCDIMFDTARLLFYRGIDTVEKVRNFLSPGKSRFYDPFLLSGMKEAVERVKIAKENAQNVLVFGDYDADGICAVTILKKALEIYGIQSQTIIPEREDGYGLNLDIISKLHQEKPIDLVITVDCGISDYLAIEQLTLLGIDVVVTDHHEPPAELPNCIKINPKLQGQEYPFQGLCGAGVSYKLAQALIGNKADDFLDFVALATVADSMDLIDENRSLVVEGLKIFNSDKVKLPFKYLLGDGNKVVTAQSLAYQIAPRVNAGGRMGNANAVLDLFSETDENKIFDLAVLINTYNVQRQSECDVIYKQAKQQIFEKGYYRDRVILVADKNWKTGFIGIVAAKLVEDYKKPVIVFAGQDDFYKGSARSVEDINIYEAIVYASDALLGFGGHSQAAGVSVSEENIEVLREKLCDYISKNYPDTPTEKTINIEWQVMDKFSLRLAKEIERLEPFGVGNKKPIFSTIVNKTTQKPLKAGSNHYSFNTQAMEMLNFNGEKDTAVLALPIDKEIVFEINYSTFKGKDSVKGFVKNILPFYGDFSAVKLQVFANEIDRLKNDEPKNTQIIKHYSIDRGYGTLYVISDVKNYALLKEKIGHLPCYLFEISDKNCENAVVISLEQRPENYKRVIYLDKPVQYLPNCLSAQGEIGYSDLDKVDMSRETFATVFNSVKALNKTTVKDLSTLYNKCNLAYNEYTFIVCLKVFLELGFFEIKNGILHYNDSIKHPLTDSKIYSKILAIKGN